LIEKTNTGKYFSYDEKNLKSDILDFFSNPNNIDFENMENFSRDKLTCDLTNLLNGFS